MKIEWTEPTVLDLKSIRDYIRRDSEYYATRFVEKVIEAAETLNKLPITSIDFVVCDPVLLEPLG